MCRLIYLIAILFPVLLGSQTTTRAPASDVITIPKMRADLEFLAGDALRGRLTDTPENAIALEWMAARFKWLGLEPMGANGTYFLPYHLSLGSLGTERNELSVARGDQTTAYDLTSGFYPLRYSASGCSGGATAGPFFSIGCQRSGSTPGSIPTTT